MARGVKIKGLHSLAIKAMLSAGCVIALAIGSSTLV